MKLRELALSGVLTAVLGLSACGGPAASSGPHPVPVPKPVSAAQLKNVTLRIGDQKGSSEEVLLQAAGLLKDIPYHVQWSTFTSGPPMLEAANDNAIDVGQVGNTPPIFSAAANGNIDIVGSLRSRVGDTLLVPKNSPIHSLAQLRGKTIAVSQGSSAHGTLLNTLSKAGLKPSDVTLSYLQPSDAYAAFSQGSVAAWAIWEPYVSEAQIDLGARPLVSGADSLHGTGLAAGTPLSNGYTFQVANRAALSDPGKNSAIQDYVTRIAQADLWAESHPVQWAQIYAQETGLPLNVATSAVPGIVLAPTEITGSVVSSEQQLADAFTSAGQIPSKVDISGYFDTRYNKAVQPFTGKQ
jgi:sulfonate transport system substrate-binding protein